MSALLDNRPFLVISVYNKVKNTLGILDNSLNSIKRSWPY